LAISIIFKNMPLLLPIIFQLMKPFCFLIMLFWCLTIHAQVMDSSQRNIADSLAPKVDSSKGLLDSVHYIGIESTKKVKDTLQTLTVVNKLTKKKNPQLELPQYLRKWQNTDAVFYLIAALLLIFGILFNTSLRQSQLIDQLQQNKLASLLFNIFFLFVTGFYFALLFEYIGWAGSGQLWIFFISSTGILALVYLVKFLVLSFAGWITGYEEEAGIYIFNIFLINKIWGISLLPFVVIMTFAEKKITAIALLVSLIVIGLLLLMRFVRSYGLLQHRLSFKLFHFLLYVFSLEVLPVMLIYKSIVIFLKVNS